MVLRLDRDGGNVHIAHVTNDACRGEGNKPHISCQVGGYYTKSMRETRCLRTGPILAVDDMDSGFWLTLSPFHSS